MADVFISYKREDRGRIAPLARALEARGYTVWWDLELIAGQKWAKKIKAELDAAKCVIVAWTGACVASDRTYVSEWVENEADEALRRGVLVPALMDEGRIAWTHQKVQYATLIGWTGEPNHPGLAALIDGVVQHAGLRAKPEEVELAAWGQAERTETAEAFHAFLTAHPQSRFAEIARGRAAELEEAAAWAVLGAAPTAAALAGFLRRFPAGRFADEAEARIHALERTPRKPATPAYEHTGAAPISVPFRSPKWALPVAADDASADGEIAVEAVRGGLLDTVRNILAIDANGANTLISVAGRGIVLDEPSVVAFRVREGKRDLYAMGAEARYPIGHEGAALEIVHPLSDSQVLDPKVAREMLRGFINKVRGRSKLISPRLLLPVSAGATGAMRATWREVVQPLASRVDLMTRSCAAAVGAGLKIGDSYPNMVIDVGHTTTEIGVFALGRLMQSAVVQVGRAAFDAAIKRYFGDSEGLLVGEKEVGAAIRGVEGSPRVTMTVRGRDVATMVPREIAVDQAMIAAAVSPVVEQLVSNIRGVLDRLNPELSADLHGLVLTGDAALRPIFDEILQKELGLHVVVCDDPGRAVVRGLMCLTGHC